VLLTSLLGWGAGELTAVMSACKSLKRLIFTGRVQASTSALHASETDTRSFEVFRADQSMSLAEASKLLRQSHQLQNLRIR